MSDPAAGAPRGRRRRLILVGVVVIAILAVGYVGLTFLGSQVVDAQRGTVEFGTSGSGCIVEGLGSRFPSDGASIYEAAHLTREVRTGEVVTFRVSQDGTEVASVPRTFDAAGDCVSGSLPGALLTPGHYRVEYLAGSELLAAGEFDIQP